MLVVDDNADFRECMAELLAAEGATVSVARDGVEALAQLALDPLPEVVLLDVRMPKLDGYAVLRAIRANPRLAAVRVIAVTAGDFDEPGVPCLVKPFTIEVLLGYLEAAFRGGSGPPAAGPGA